MTWFANNRRWIIALLALLTTACFLIAWMQASFECREMPATWPDGCRMLKFLYDWQQLLGALTAIVAAVIGWLAIHRQMQQAEEHERERVRGRYAAARAALPHALSTISEYTQTCIGRLIALHNARNGERIVSPPTGWTRPELDVDALIDLRSIIEVCDVLEGQVFSKLLARLQIQSARLRTLEQDLNHDQSVVVRTNIEQYLVDTIEIQARVNTLFSFGRGNIDHVPLGDPTVDQMNSAAFTLKLYRGPEDEIRERIDRLFGPQRDLVSGDVL